MPRCDTGPVVEWLVDGARSAPQAQDVLAQLCPRLVACGIPLWRAAVFVRTLHPEMMGRSFVWRPDGEVAVNTATYEFMATADYAKSPVATVYQTREPVRRRLADAGCPIDFPVLDDLLKEGVSDYFAAPLFFTDDAVHVATWSTRTAGGFSDSQIAGLQAILAPLARVAEIRALRRTATNLLDTYVGHQTGTRILAGRIRRGHTEAIDAAIWLSDMRGFTSLADSLAPLSLVDLLNRYFDCQVPAILEQGGEVLKFMGDGLLAIFPIGLDGKEDEICGRALAAAREARKRLAAIDWAAIGPGVGEIRFGLALHLGTVLYGNIGSGDRLDFTCIGPAVNLAARLEKLAGRLGRAIVASEDFARRCGAELLPIGDHALPGFMAPQPVFGLKEE